MRKEKAIELLGGSVAAAARALNVSYQAVDKWPDELSSRVAERVIGAYAKDKLPELGCVAGAPEADSSEAG